MSTTEWIAEGRRLPNWYEASLPMSDEEAIAPFLLGRRNKNHAIPVLWQPRRFGDRDRLCPDGKRLNEIARSQQIHDLRFNPRAALERLGQLGTRYLRRLARVFGAIRQNARGQLDLVGGRGNDTNRVRALVAQLLRALVHVNEATQLYIRFGVRSDQCHQARSVRVTNSSNGRLQNELARFRNPALKEPLRKHVVDHDLDVGEGTKEAENEGVDVVAWCGEGDGHVQKGTGLSGCFLGSWSKGDSRVRGRVAALHAKESELTSGRWCGLTLDGFR